VGDLFAAARWSNAVLSELAPGFEARSTLEHDPPPTPATVGDPVEGSPERASNETGAMGEADDHEGLDHEADPPEERFADGH
jgi:hypothetical protein